MSEDGIEVREKSNILFLDDRTDWVISTFGKEVDLILRLKKRCLKVKRKVKPISINDLAAVASASFTEANQKVFLKNSRHAYRIARAMAHQKEYRESFLYLHLSLEHLLKHIWVKLIYAYEKRFLEAMPSVQDNSGSDAKFSHDMSFLMKSLFKAVPDLPSNTRARAIFSSLALSKKYGKWSDIRYTVDPISPITQTDFLSYYKHLRASILPFVVDLKKMGLLI